MKRTIFITVECVVILLLLSSHSTPAMLIGFPLLLCLSRFMEDHFGAKPEFYVASFDTKLARQKRAVALLERDN